MSSKDGVSIVLLIWISITLYGWTTSMCPTTVVSKIKGTAHHKQKSTSKLNNVTMYEEGTERQVLTQVDMSGLEQVIETPNSV